MADSVQYALGLKTSVVGTGMFSFIKLGTPVEPPAEGNAVSSIIQSHPGQVVLFVTPGCPYCADAVQVLSHEKVPFATFTIENARFFKFDGLETDRFQPLEIASI